MLCKINNPSLDFMEVSVCTNLPNKAPKILLLVLLGRSAKRLSPRMRNYKYILIRLATQIDLKASLRNKMRQGLMDTNLLRKSLLLLLKKVFLQVSRLIDIR